MNDPKAAAAYHPSDGRVTRPDLDALLSELDTCAWFTDGTKNGELVELAYFTRHRIAKGLRDAMATLAAETARADHAEQRIADTPHDTECEVNRTEPSDHSYDNQCDCWKSAAPTAEQ